MSPKGKKGFGRLITEKTLYIGFWNENKYNGKGKLVENGVTQEGTFENGVYLKSLWIKINHLNIWIY